MEKKKLVKDKNNYDEDDEEVSAINEIDEAINKIFQINSIEEEGIKYELNFWKKSQIKNINRFIYCFNN